MTTKSKPILFSAPMVQALLREIEAPGTGKTQTRRVIKPQPRPLNGEQLLCGAPTLANDWAWPDPKFRGCTTISCKPNGPDGYTDHCPYGKIGDLLYVRESWQAHSWASDCVTIRYRAEEKTKGFTDQIEQIPYPQGEKTAFKFVKPEGPHKWKPSIHMPRWASRITLEVTDVRVQRLQDISEEDAKAEGVERLHDGWFPYGISTFMTITEDGCEVPAQYCREAKDSFRMLWESINGPESWKSNDWVWAVSFKPHLINVDQMIKERAAA